MSNLSSFADLVRKSNEERKLRGLQERDRQEKEVAPLLSELFASVSKAKEVQRDTNEKEAPLLQELQDALSDPEKFKQEKVEKKNKIVDLITELENKAHDIRVKVDAPELPNKEVVTDLEKKFLKLFNRLQNDFQTLKKYIEAKSTQSPIGFGGAGSGEVRILRMDDVVKEVPVNGSVLTWDATLNKFKCSLPTVGDGSTTTDEEMPYAKRVDFVSENELYKGEAIVGSSETLSVWRIRRITIGVDGDVTEVWANGNANYINMWSNRLTYSYS